MSGPTASSGQGDDEIVAVLAGVRGIGTFDLSRKEIP
jgi:hypothetical protein